MDRTTTTALIVSAFVIVSLRAQHVLIQPSSYGTSFDGQALALECVAALKGDDARRLVEIFRAKSNRERRVCLDQLQQSLTPEPDFNTGRLSPFVEAERSGQL